MDKKGEIFGGICAIVTDPIPRQYKELDIPIVYGGLKNMCFEELERHLKHYVAKPTSARKGLITKAIKALEGKATASQIEKILNKAEAGLTNINGFGYWRDKLNEKLTLYESDFAQGKWRVDQLLSEELPLRKIGNNEPGYRVARQTMIDQSRGFYYPERLPVQRFDESGESGSPMTEVHISSSWRWREFAKHGYAEAWHLPLMRKEGDDKGWYVQTSIQKFGYWVAWKWWQGCQDWYFDHHPEWFWDDPLWENQPFQAWAPPGVAIISPKSLETYQSVEVYDANASRTISKKLGCHSFIH